MCLQTASASGGLPSPRHPGLQPPNENSWRRHRGLLYIHQSVVWCGGVMMTTLDMRSRARTGSVLGVLLSSNDWTSCYQTRATVETAINSAPTVSENDHGTICNCTLLLSSRIEQFCAHSSQRVILLYNTICRVIFSQSLQFLYGNIKQ